MQNRFSRFRPKRPSWISNRNDFSYLFLNYMLPKYFQPSFDSTGLSVQEKHKIEFQEGAHGSNLGFPIRMSLAMFDLHLESGYIFKMADMAVIWDFRSERFQLF